MEPRSTASPAERRRLQQREDARRAILDATEALLVEGGYEQFSMRRLAARCGYTAPTIYHYFGDKRGLIDAVLEERYQEILLRLQAVPRHSDPADVVRAIMDVFVRFSLENPTHYRLLNAPRLDDSPPPASADAIRALLESPLEDLQRASRLQVEVEEAVQCLWVMLHGLISMRINRPDYEWSDRLEDLSLGALLRGLIAPGGNGDARGGRAPR